MAKNHPRIAAFGTIDELNAAVGLARAHVRQDPPCMSADKRERALTALADLQNLLFVVGCDLSTPLDKRDNDMPLLEAKHTADIERKIQIFDRDLPPLREFVLPTGIPAVAALHLARTICRRAEREAVALRETEPIGDAVAPFLNRLSDYLFVFARWLVFACGEEETTWQH